MTEKNPQGTGQRGARMVKAPHGFRGGGTTPEPPVIEAGRASPLQLFNERRRSFREGRKQGGTVEYDFVSHP